MSDAPTPKRFSVSLQARLVLGVIALIVLCMGAAIAATTVLGNQIAERAIQDDLNQSQRLQARFVQLSLQQLEVQARWFARDPAVVSYFLEAVDTQSTLSILDQLAEVQREVQFDLAMVLDPDGVLVARTDQPEAEPVDLGGLPLVEAAFDEGSAAGFWLDGTSLYTAVAMPLTTQQFDLAGFLLMANRFDDELAQEIGRLSSAEIAFLADGESGVDVVASTLDPASASRLLVQVRSRGGVGSVLENEGNVLLELGSEPYEGLVAPLRDPYGERIGATVALASRRAGSSSLVLLQRILWGVGLLSLLLGVALASLLARRLLRPVRDLVGAAERARDGDYDVTFGEGGSDEVGRLSQAFGALLDQLRGERDLRGFVRQISRSLPEPGEVAIQPASSAIQSDEMAIGAIDLRASFADGMLDRAAELAERLESEMRRVQQHCQLHDGDMVGLFGHRLLLGFRGNGAVSRALVAISDSMRSLSAATNAFYEPAPPMAALTVGKALSGPLRVGPRSQFTVAGPAVQSLGVLLREAAPGDFVLSRRVRDLVGADLERVAVPLKERDSLLSTQQLFFVDAQAVSRDFKPRLEEFTGPAESEATLVMSATVATMEGPEIELGTVLGERYEVLSVLGMGGMGVVYKARDRELSDLVALKALRKSLVAPNTQGEGVAASLKDELKLARKVTHPNVLRTYDFQVIDGRPLISMEYVRGITLREIMDGASGIPRSAGVRILQQLCAGLGAAHEQEVLHCDIKPENVILEADGNAKLMDFGIARPLAARGAQGNQQVVGTPYYMAPEQITGSSVTARSDVYACGIVAYELLVGKRPFVASSAKEVFRMHLQDEPKRPREVVPEIPAWLEEVVLRCLAKDPAARYANADELESALGR